MIGNNSCFKGYFMEQYIQISKINDFIFCPKSLYFHSLYENFSENVYHQEPQKTGKLNHQNIEDKKYSTAKKILQGVEVYSQKYNIAGKIDIYDQEKKELIERKTKVKNIYDGYHYQLYAQYFGLLEEGYDVKKMFIHSLTDNKRYEVPLPNKKETAKFESVVSSMHSFDIFKIKKYPSKAKCDKCIYKLLCH